MKNFLFALFIFFCSFFQVEAKWYYDKINCNPFIHTLISAYEFEGDRHSQFKGDTVVVLEDGSAWKIHSKHLAKFEQWTAGDRVHVGLRTSFYFFKREHKFTLYNHDRNEEVFVMLITSPYSIEYTSEPVMTRYYPNLFGDIPILFCKNITLSNNSKWEVEAEAKEFTKKEKKYQDLYFKLKSPAYIGYNVEKDKTYFFVISGDQREANHRWARMGHYIYK